MTAYHAVRDQIENLSRFAFRCNFLAEYFRSIFNTRSSRNPSNHDSFAARLFEGFFDSAPIMNRCKRGERK